MYHFFSIFSWKFIEILRILTDFFYARIWRFSHWIMKIIEKIDRVTPRDFDQIWIILQIIEPNEDLSFFKILEKPRFVSSRVWQIIVLNYDFIFQKNRIFLIFENLIRFLELKSHKSLNTERDLNKIKNFSVAFLIRFSFKKRKKNILLSV